MEVPAFNTLNVRADFLDFNLKYIYYIGLWPIKEVSNKKRFLYGLYNCLLFIFAFLFILSTGVGLYNSKNDIIFFLLNVDKVIVSYNYILKTVVFINNRRYIRILIHDILYSGDQITDERKGMMKYFVFVVFGGSFFVAGGFQIQAQMNGELTLDTWFPFDPSKSIWLILLGNTIIGAVFLFSFNCRGLAIKGLVCSIAMYITDQLIELQKRLKSLNYTKDNETNTRKELKEIIQKHIRIIGYAKATKEGFQEYFLIQNLAVTTELCLNALLMSIVGFEQKKLLLNFLAFLTLALFNSYIYCYLGNELMDQSVGIAQAAYESNWTSWPLDMQKDLLIIITVSQRGVTLSAGGISTLSMRTFAEIAVSNNFTKLTNDFWVIYEYLNDVVTII
ncbi:hypothetical protein ACJJTC_003622 [Scirpophaga incertulas]